MNIPLIICTALFAIPVVCYIIGCLIQFIKDYKRHRKNRKNQP